MPKHAARLPLEVLARGEFLKSVLFFTRSALGVAGLVLGVVLLLTPSGDAPAPSRSLAGDAGSAHSGAHGSGCATHHLVNNSLQGTLCFIVVCFVACCALEHSNLVTPHGWRLPISVVLFLAGMFTGLAFQNAGEGVWNSGFDVFFQGMQSASYLDPHAIFYILLPPLLYESASSMSWRVFRKVLRSSVLLALPGVVLNTGLTACFVKLVFRVGSHGATWETSLLLASILSATDPVAVVASLHELGAPKKLATLIEGESLLNDGSAVVLFFVFLDMAATGLPAEMRHCAAGAGSVVVYFLRLALGGPVLGTAVGFVLSAWIGRGSLHNTATLELSIVLAAVYGTFFIAESIQVSGVLAVVTLGVVVSASVSPRMSTDGRHAHHHVLSQIGHACNQIIFFGAGIISARFMWTTESEGCNVMYKSGRSWLELLSLYVWIHVTRACVILVFSPLLVRLGYGITFKEGIVLVWGGLRGAVGLAMGLIVEHNRYVDSDISALVAFHVSGIVLLTLLVNGTTVDKVYNWLDLYPVNPFRRTYLRNVLAMVEDDCNHDIVECMADDWFFQDVDFQTIFPCVPKFSSIEFGQSGQAYPDNVETVFATLNSLEGEMTKFSRNLHSKLHKRMRRASSWEIQKESNSATFIDALQRSTNVQVNVKDLMINVKTNSDHRLDFIAQPSAVDVWGLYVSAQPLKALRPNTENEVSFSCQIHNTKGSTAFVGLIAATSPPTDGMVEGREKELLGTFDSSVSFDCGSGGIRYQSPEDMGDIQTGRSVSDSEVVHIRVREASGSRYEISFLVEADGVLEKAGSCMLPFSPDELYPSMQFRPSIGRVKRQGSQQSIFSLLSRSSRSENTIASEKHSRRMTSITSWTHLGGASSRTLARVTVDFEILTATMGESMAQLFHVIFNTVSQHYNDMHELGLIGNEAFSWLSEGVAAAVEATDGELNHVRAEDFSRYRSMRVSLSAGGIRRTSEVLRQTLAEDPYAAMFEPILVEYLVLEDSCSTDSWLDKLPSWGFVRRLGYARALSQVESLWAFIEAHTKLLEGCPALQRYPHLLDCLGSLVDEAKRDLRILEDLKPRRFAHCKHYLALRVMLTRKLEKLRSVVRNGWLSREDIDSLERNIWTRILQASRFVPRVSLPSRKAAATAPTTANNSEQDTVSDDGDFMSRCDSLPLSSCAHSSVTPTARAKLLAMLEPEVAPRAMPEDRAFCHNFQKLFVQADQTPGSASFCPFTGKGVDDDEQPSFVQRFHSMPITSTPAVMSDSPSFMSREASTKSRARSKPRLSLGSAMNVSLRESPCGSWSSVSFTTEAHEVRTARISNREVVEFAAVMPNQCSEISVISVPEVS